MTPQDTTNIYAVLKNTAESAAVEPGFSSSASSGGFTPAPVHRPFPYATAPEQPNSPMGSQGERKMKTKYQLLRRRGETQQQPQTPAKPYGAAGPPGMFYTPYSPSSARTLNFKEPANVAVSQYDVRIIIQENYSAHPGAELSEQ